MLLLGGWSVNWIVIASGWPTYHPHLPDDHRCHDRGNSGCYDVRVAGQSQKLG